jgi:hypothetical protein
VKENKRLVSRCRQDASQKFCRVYPVVAVTLRAADVFDIIIHRTQFVAALVA